MPSKIDGIFSILNIYIENIEKLIIWSLKKDANFPVIIFINSLNQTIKLSRQNNIITNQRFQKLNVISWTNI